MASIKELNLIASQIRRDILRQVHNAGSGHPGGALGCTELFVALFFEIMKHDPNFNMEAVGEDIFYLSNGHISPVYYSTLARSGYFSINELSTFREINGRLQGHPTTHEGLPGIRIASGSLGQGLSVAVGSALAKRLNNDDRWVYISLGDGELQEGQIWEAAMSAAHYKLDRLVAVVDWNGVQIDGRNDDVMSLGDLVGKWRTFGWTVLHVKGNSMRSMIAALNKAKNLAGQEKPVVLLSKTEMGYPVDFMMGTHKWHGKAPDDEQLANALSQLPETLGDY